MFWTVVIASATAVAVSIYFWCVLFLLLFQSLRVQVHRMNCICNMYTYFCDFLFLDSQFLLLGHSFLFFALLFVTAFIADKNGFVSLFICKPEQMRHVRVCRKSGNDKVLCCHTHTHKLFEHCLRAVKCMNPKRQSQYTLT